MYISGLITLLIYALSGSAPSNAMLYADGTPMLYADGSFMLYAGS